MPPDDVTEKLTTCSARSERALLFRAAEAWILDVTANRSPEETDRIRTTIRVAFLKKVPKNAARGGFRRSMNRNWRGGSLGACQWPGPRQKFRTEGVQVGRSECPEQQ
jgi:hypothetical protein